MNTTSLYTYIESELTWQLIDPSNINVGGIASDLAEGLKSQGYCSDPYFEYDKALMCPINKKREKHCNMVLCPSHTFCEMLRKEGYV